uniref:mucin-22 n=1 Tax=Semicossyphus pulcher TaxID=241346 RepID=UPI0037E86F8A
MKLGLLVVLAVVALVPSLSEGRTVSKCELRQKLSKELNLPKSIREKTLAIVICELNRKYGLNTSLVQELATTTVEQEMISEEMISEEETAETPTPETMIPETMIPETMIPETPTPETMIPETMIPETPTPETPTPETMIPETMIPETTTPETMIPETTTPETMIPETTTPETTTPETTTPETMIPETTTPETTTPETTTPETTTPETTTPETTTPETTTPETTTPETMTPETTTPETMTPETTTPETPTTEAVQTTPNAAVNKRKKRGVNEYDQISSEENEESTCTEYKLMEELNNLENYCDEEEIELLNNMVEEDGSFSLGSYGLFQLSDGYFCKSDHRQSKDICGKPCSAFTDDDITDDIKCFVKTTCWKNLVFNSSGMCCNTKNYFKECK